MKLSRLTLYSSIGAALGGLAATGAWSQKVDSADAANVCVAPHERDLPMTSLTAQRRRELISCSVRHGVNQLQPQLPMRVDEITTLETVEAVDTTVIYRSRVDVDVRNVTAQMRANLRQSTRNNVCNSDDMRQTIGNGGGYTYFWVDRSGNFIDRADINSC